MASQYKNHAADCLNNKHWTNSVPEKATFFGYTTQDWHWFTCTRCGSICVPLRSSRHLDTSRIPCKKRWIAFTVVWVLFLPFRPRALNWEQLRFVVCVLKSKIVNSNLPHLRSLVSVSCIEIIVQVWLLILSSVRSNKHMMAPLSALCERRDYKLVHLNSRSHNDEIVDIQSALNDDYNNFQETSNTYHIPETIFGRFFPNLVLVRSLRSSFIDSFSTAKKRCNTSQGFGAFFGQSCDRDRFLFPFISELIWFWNGIFG